MPNAVTHFLIPLVLLGLFQDFFVRNKKTFPIHYVFIGGLAGLLPDFDIAVYYILSFFGITFQEVHRTFSHNFFVPLIFVSLGFAFWKFKTRKLGKYHLKLRTLFFVIAFGIFTHLLLDATISGQILPLYPISHFSFGLNLVSIFPKQWQNSIIPSLDAALLILWMIYIEVKHKISDFI